MSILLSKETTFIVQGITGREAVNLTRECLDYGSRVVGGVTPGRKGREVHGVPVFDTVAQAVEHHGGPIDGSVVTVPPAFTKDADEPETRAHILAVRRYLVLFYRLAMQGLRSEKNLDAVAALLGPGDREALEPVNARAYVALTMLTRHVKALHAAGKLTDANVITIDGGITTLIDSLGGCERIVKTPVPFAYAQHIKVFVILFTLTIPFAVVDMLKWGTPIASAILGFALFGIDEIGVEIEDPFGYDENDLPVERIGDVIDASTKDIVGG